MSWWRRCAVFTVVFFGLSVAVPAQVVQGGGGFPLGWLADLFRLPTVWASATGLPGQARRDPGHGGYVSAAETTANGGAGRKVTRVGDGLDGYLPHDASTGSATTDPQRRGYVAATSKRQAAGSSAAMDEYANADGSLTRAYSTGTTNYRAADGSWRKIDPTLVAGAAGRWTMKANSLRVSLGATSADAEPLASVTLPSGQSVGYDLDGAATVAPVVAGSTATYPSILPGTDLELQTITSGVEETLVLDSASAVNEWVFPLHLSGLTPRMARGGSVELVDASGAVVAWFPHGSMTDARFDMASGDFTRSSAVTMSLTTLDGGPALKVVADRAWLDDPARVYPVRVDPTLTTVDTSDAYVDNDPATGPGDQVGNNLPVGTYDSGYTTAHSFLHFGNFGTQVNGAKITAANLRLHLTWQYSCTQNRPFSVYPVVVPWSVTDLATMSVPGPDVASSSLGSLTVTNPGVACTNTSGDRSVGVWVTVPLSVAALNAWTVNGTNYGLALTASGTDSNAWKRFTSARFSSGDYAPELVLTYTSDVVPQVDTRYPANNATVPTLTPQLGARAHDPDAWPNKGLTYAYTVYNSAGAAVVSSGTLTTPSWQVPAGKLTWNNTYYYRVVVGDKLHTAAATTAYAFSTPVPQPRLTADLAQNPGVGFDPNNGNYTTSATDARVAGVGPALEISRSYNSLDTRRAGAFGQGWSSILDVKATERYDTSGAVQTVVVTYPNGSEVAFGRNADGTFTAPSGRYAVLAAQTSGSTVTGYTLTDKDATRYVFGRSAGSGVFKVTSIADANGRALTFAYDAGTGLISTVTGASGRKLTLTWATGSSPTVGAAHVASVTTDPPTAGGTGYTWTYGYGTYDRLTTVCPPGTTTACTVYTWGNWNNQYADAATNLNPYSFWRLNETSGDSAASSVLTNAGVDNGTFKNVTLGGASALADSTSPSATFPGAASYVQLPGKLVADGSYQSLSMWFKTSTAGGVLFGYSAAPITAGTASSNFTPALYVDANGYLRGEFWQGTPTPIKSASVVTDGVWHHVVLSGAGNTQTMYLDGAPQGLPLSGTIAMVQTSGSAYEYIGAGFVGYGWPDHANTGGQGIATYFTGSIAEVGFYNKALTSPEVSGMYWVGKNSSSVIQKVTSPAGRVQAQVAVSTVTGQVTSVTDANGGVWTMGTPRVSGSSDVYEAAVLGGKPTDYWRLGEIDADVTDAVNEVAGDTATYSSATLGGGGPFADTTAAGFNGSTSSVALPGTVATDGANSVGMWFNTTVTGRVIYGAQAGALGDTTAPGLPSLWISADGKLRGLSPSTTPTGPLRLGLPGKCADVTGAATANGTKIEIWTCNGGTAQNWTWYADGTVRALGKCLDVTGAATANSTKIELYTCNSGPAQIWQPYNGGLRNPNSGKCLADPASSTTDGTQLILWTCNGIADQTWTMSLATAAAVNDGAWHQAVLTTSGTAQALYVDGVKVSSTTGSVPLTPGSQPHAYLGAGHIGAGWSGLPAATTSYFSGKLAEAAFFDAELSADQVAAQWSASRQAVPVAVTAVDTTVTTITMPVKTVTVTDPGGNSLSYAYDLVNNRQVAETDALGNTTRYGYDTGGFSNLVYDPNGVWTQAVQDARGNTIQRITCQDQSAGKCSSVYFEYYLNASNPVDPRNDAMTASRDARSASSTDNTYKTSYAYDAKGNPTSSTDPLGRVTTAAYTDGTGAPAGLPSQVVNAAGNARTISYNAGGDVTQTVSPAGEVTAYTYDQLGRRLTETVTTSSFPGGRTSSFTYDQQGRVISGTDAPVTNRVTGAVHTPVTTNGYDADGNLTSQTVADTTGGDVTRTQTVTYNAYGQKAVQSDALGNTTSFTYNAYGQVVSETDADGGVTAFGVDPDGNVLTETTKDWTGDANNPGSATDLVTKANTYDPAGRLAGTTDAMGWTTSYTYTDDGLTASVKRTDGTTTFVQEQNTYDPAGNLTTQVTDNGATTTKLTYDAAGRRTSTVLDPAGLNRVITNELSADDNVVSVTQRVGSASALAVSDYQYDAEGRLRAQTAYNGDPATTPVARWKLNGTAADGTGNSPGAATGVTWPTSAPSGMTGSAAFAGTNDSRVATTGPVLDTTRSYTVSAWVYLTATGVNRAAVSQDGATRSAFLLGYHTNSNRWRILVSKDSNTETEVTSAAAPALSTWTHLTAVYDASVAGSTKVTLYVNGAPQGNATTTSMPSSGPLIIGGGKWFGNKSDPWAGQVADVQVYQRPLSATQVAAVYGGTAPAAGATVARTSSTLDEGGLATRTVDPLGNATDVAYDEAERPAVTTGAPVTAETATSTVTARPVSLVGYDTFGDRTETVDGNGNETTYVYDRAGQLYETHRPSYTTPDGSTTINPVTSTAYDSLGQPTSTTDELGNTTEYTYDQFGRVAKTVAPNDGVTKVGYDLNGDPLSVTGPTGAVATRTYDFLGRPVTSTQAVRQTGTAYTTNYAYDTAGRLQNVTSPAGVTQSYTYNPAGETLTSVDGAGQTTTATYDGLGRTTKVTQPGGSYRTTGYDMLSRATAATAYASGGSVLTTAARGYDRAGNVLTSTDGRGTSTSYGYDATGLLLSENQPVSATASITTSFGYDLDGNRTRFTDGRGYAFWTTYNTWGLPESTIEPATAAFPAAADRTYTTSYDAAGRPVSLAAPGGVEQSFAYDSLGHLTSQAGTGAAVATTTRTFGYDLAGRMTSFSAPSGTNTVSYDDRDLPTSISGPSGNSSFTYTADGLMASRTDAAGSTAYTYDSADRLATLKNATAGSDLTYAYDTDSAVSKITYGGTGNTRNFTYDGLKRLTSDELKTSAGTSIAKIAYGWDANSNETSKTTPAAANTYGYDLADRLTSWNNGATTVGYTYDAAGNRTGRGSTTYTYDQRNRLVSDSFTYTARGTLATAAGQVTTSDAFDQVITQSGSTYGYDALGRALRAGFSYTGTGNDLAADAGASYVRDPDDDVVGVSSGGVGRLVWTDLHDDVVGQFTATGATLAGSAVFDPLGAVVSSSGMLGSLGYQSEWTDGLTGRVNMAARWYNPGTGQFDSRDTVANNPVPDSVNANRYQYANANPLTGTDPSGHGLLSSLKSAYNTSKSFVSDALSTLGSYASYAYHTASSYYYQAKAALLSAASVLARKVGAKGVATKAEQNRRNAAKKAQAEKQRAEKARRDAERKGQAIKQRAARAVSKASKVVKDAWKNTVKQKKQILQIAPVLAPIASSIKNSDGLADKVTDGIQNTFRGAYKGMGDALYDGTIAIVGVAWGSFKQGLEDGQAYSDAVKNGDMSTWDVLGASSKKALGDLWTADDTWEMAKGLLEHGVKIVTADTQEERTYHASYLWTTVALAYLGDRAKQPGCYKSFGAGTQVLLADGSKKKFSELKPGDEVLATDPESGEEGPRRVEAVWVHKDDLYELSVDGHRLVTTEDHPFWDETDQRWENADQLDPGDLVRTPTGAAHVTAFDATAHHYADAYNLTVEDIHTYYVLAGNTPILVHNAGGCPRNAKGQFTSGENVDAARGRLTHQNYRTALGDGYDYEFTLPSGRRPDAIDWNNRVVRELKSDAPSSQATGRRQLAGYVEELEQMTGQKWTGHLDTYSR